MHDWGGAKFAVLGMLMTSAVAIFFSWSSLTLSDATDLSDRMGSALLLWASFSETSLSETLLT
jgi:hypothetical protein